MIKLLSDQSDYRDDHCHHNHPEFPIKVIIMTTIYRWAVTVTSGVCAYPLDSVKRRMMMTAGEEVIIMIIFMITSIMTLDPNGHCHQPNDNHDKENDDNGSIESDHDSSS